jgi:hypothetical protein
MKKERDSVSQTPVSRTPEKVLQEYGQEKWPAMERLIASERQAEPDATLGRILGRVARSQSSRPEPLATTPFLLDGELARIPVSGAFGAAQGILLDLVNDACTAETDLVVELGSGWGWHILSAWATGGPRRATYVAAEFTEAGRRAASSIAELDPDLDFRAVAFDYNEPDLDELGRHEHAVVFTAHSIEQIPYVKPELFAALRRIARNVTCLHFEPVGWQVERHDGRGTSAAYAEQHDYSRNLVEMVRAEADAGRIELDVLQPDVFGINPSNSTTIIRWRASSAD